jgi:hypothetical protein
MLGNNHIFELYAKAALPETIPTSKKRSKRRTPNAKWPFPPKYSGKTKSPKQKVRALELNAHAYDLE